MNKDSGAINEKLVRDIMHGDSKAMRRLYDLTVSSMTAVCSRYVPNDDDVKDVLQDSYIKIFSNLSTFRYKDESSLCSWMSRIVINESLQLLRRMKSNPFIMSLEDAPENDIIEGEETALAAIASKLDIGEMMKLVRQLPDGYRTVFNLFAIEQLPHRTIASMLGISENTSASQFHRARKLLAQKIMDLKNSIT
ncbi:MAG: sigma-70 family RNA polymerase sigma factor [Muribaculaceae bacterium]|nr:sigma-70 family RNA polymerase sigma factor [Muribaculaceae bacterium]